MILQDSLLLLSKGLESQNGRLGHIVNLVLAQLVSGVEKLTLDQWDVLWSYVGILEDSAVLWNTLVVVITHLGEDQLLLGMSLRRIVASERIFVGLSQALRSKTHLAPIEWYFVLVLANFPTLKISNESSNVKPKPHLALVGFSDVAPMVETPPAQDEDAAAATGTSSSSPAPPLQVSIAPLPMEVRSMDVDSVVSQACGVVFTAQTFCAELTTVLDQCQASGSGSQSWQAMPTFRRHVQHLLLLSRLALRRALQPPRQNMCLSPSSSSVTGDDGTGAVQDGDATATAGSGSGSVTAVPGLDPVLPEPEVVTAVCRLLLELLEVFEHCKYCEGEEGADTDSAAVGADGGSVAGTQATGRMSALETRSRLVTEAEAAGAAAADADWLGDMVGIAAQTLCEYVRHHCGAAAFAARAPSASVASLAGDGYNPQAVSGLISFTDTLQLLSCGVEPGRQLLALECLRFYLLPVQTSARQAAAAAAALSAGPSSCTSVLTSQTDCDQSLSSPATRTGGASSRLSASASRPLAASARVGSAPQMEKQRSTSLIQSGSVRGSSKSKPSGDRAPSPSQTQAQSGSRKGSSTKASAPLKRAVSVVAPLPRKSGGSGSNPTNRGPNVVEEVCKCGAIRVLCWFLLHVSARARELTCEVLDTCMRADAYSLGVLHVNLMEQGLLPLLQLVRRGRTVDADSSTTDTSADAGLFPERGVRDCASRLVHSCQAYLSQGQGQVDSRDSTDTTTTGIGIGFSGKVKSGVQVAKDATATLTSCAGSAVGVGLTRLRNALVYSGNNRLKLNLFAAFLHLCMAPGQSSNAGAEESDAVDVNGLLNLYGDPTTTTSTIVSATGALAGGGTEELSLEELPLFEQVLLGTVSGGGGSGSAGNIVALYSFVAVIVHLYREWLGRLQTRVSALSGVAAELQAEVQSQGQAARKNAHQLKPTVCIQTAPSSHVPQAAKDQTQTLCQRQFVKMQCPPVAVLEREAPLLCAAMRELGDQLGGSTGPPEALKGSLLVRRGLVVPRATVHEVESTEAADDGAAAVVAFTFGAYPQWQELFSHITDAYLLTMGTKKLSLGFLLQCLAIAHTYRIEGLVEAYVGIVAKKYLGTGGSGSAVGGTNIEHLLKIFAAAFMDTREGAFDGFDAGKDACLSAQLAAASIRASRAWLVLTCLQYSLPRLEALFASAGYPSNRPGSQFLINQQNQQQLIRYIFRSLKLLLSSSGAESRPTPLALSDQ